jgi:serine/threonine protein kinase/tetratricopeptide (TPR) repeat protein
MQEQAIFIEALEKEAGAERDAFLERASAGDPVLRRRIDRLLQRHAQADPLLDSPALGLRAAAEESVREGPGTVIGAYRLVEPLGEGGFGVVFMAEQQQPVRRQVAVKVLKPGMDTRQVVARFEAERQALALMDHAHIARVLDGGETASGRPYFVMELVRGAPITEHADRHRLTPRERLELFVAVCQAVQHAHHKGIIHRDLKPANVLVTRQDGPPVVKVIDFGIAKALGPPLTAKALTTGFAQMIGTPLYMSPEQVEPSARDIDTRSDIYSLGVLLYELLAGTTPFDKDQLSRVGPDELRRIIREEEPPKPSTRITTLGQAATTISAQRQSDPRRLSQLFRGELDWIVMKALEKDRNRRYETASAFAVDVQRYLNDEPVQACPPSAGYRLRKWIRRHKPLVAASASVLIVTVAAWAVSTVLILRQRDEARTQRELARQAVDSMYTEVAEEWLAQQSHLQEVQRRFLLEALRYYEAFAQEPGTDPALRLRAATAYRRVGEIQFRLGEPARAEDAYARAVGIQAELAAAFPNQPEYRRELAVSRNSQALLWMYYGKLQEAEQALCEAVDLHEKLAAESVPSPQDQHQLAVTRNHLALLYGRRDRPREAEQTWGQALAVQKQLVADYPEVTRYQLGLANSYKNLAGHRYLARQYPEAETTFQQAIALQKRLADDSPGVIDYRLHLAQSYHHLANVLRDTDQYKKAEPALRQAVTLFQRLAHELPGNSQCQEGLAKSHRNLGYLLWETGRPNEAARESFRRARDLYDHLVKSNPDAPAFARDLAWFLADCPDPCCADVRRAMHLADQAVAQPSPDPAWWNILGIARYRAGEWQAAIEALNKSVTFQAGGPSWGGPSWDAFYLAMAHRQLGHDQRAREWYQQACNEMVTSPFGKRKLLRLRAEAAALLGMPLPQEWNRPLSNFGSMSLSGPAASTVRAAERTQWVPHILFTRFQKFRNKKSPHLFPSRSAVLNGVRGHA